LTVDWEYCLFPSSESGALPNNNPSIPNPRVVFLSEYRLFSSSIKRNTDSSSSSSSSSSSFRWSSPAQIEGTPEIAFDDDLSYQEWDRLNNPPSNNNSNPVSEREAGPAAAVAVVAEAGSTTDKNSSSVGSSSALVQWQQSVFDYKQRNTTKFVHHLPIPNNTDKIPSSTGTATDNRSGLSIESVLGSFTSSEEIEDYYCEHCRSLKKGFMQSSLSRAPDVLILHLKRLVMNSSGGMKVRTLVKFPLNDLDISSFMTGKNTERWNPNPNPILNTLLSFLQRILRPKTKRKWQLQKVDRLNNHNNPTLLNNDHPNRPAVKLILTISSELSIISVNQPINIILIILIY
jgi:hypothetical protein